jgi:hypothetical protein
MKDSIKSKLTKDTVYWTVLPGGLVLLMSILGFVNGVKKYLFDDTDITKLFWLLLICIAFPILIINIMKIRSYIITDAQLKYYSFWHPFGKTLYFNDYIGKIITTETGIEGSYKVVYLVDKCNRTRLKLMGLYYKNFEEIIEAIPLKTIRFSPTTGRYFKLLSTGRIKVEKTDSKPKNRNAEQRIKTVIFISVTVATLLFVIGMIVKMILKII